MLILLALPSTEGAAVITGTGWRREGGPATWARWSMARASAWTLDGARGLSARPSRSRRLPATTSRAQWGCIGACQKGRRRAVSDRTAAWRTGRTKNRAGRQATGILNTVEPTPWRPAPSLHREAVPTRSSARKDRETDDARLQPPGGATSGRSVTTAAPSSSLSPCATSMRKSVVACAAIGIARCSARVASCSISRSFSTWRA
jgi:hypothetical protein